MEIIKYKALIVVSKINGSIIIDSEPKLDDFDGWYLEDNIVELESIPNEDGIYKCDIICSHDRYMTQDGYEYDIYSKIENAKLIIVDYK